MVGFGQGQHHVVALLGHYVGSQGQIVNIQDIDMLWSSLAMLWQCQNMAFVIFEFAMPWLPSPCHGHWEITIFSLRA